MVSTDDMRGYRVLVAWIVITGSLTYVYNGRGTAYFEKRKTKCSLRISQKLRFTPDLEEK